MTRALALWLVLTAAALAVVALVLIAAWIATGDDQGDDGGLGVLDGEWWDDDDDCPDVWHIDYNHPAEVCPTCGYRVGGDDDFDPVDLTVEFPAIATEPGPYVSKHHADTVREIGDWYHPLYNREFGRTLDGDARWMVSA